MPKIAMVGAGSIVFAKTLFQDIVATPALAKAEFRFMSRTMPKLERLKRFADAVIAENGLEATTHITTSREEALRDADYVITMLQIGGVDAFQLDYEIPMKHGVDQCIADTLGPGGVFRTLRTAPVMVEIAQDMQRLCPNAYLLNYVNPMAGNDAWREVHRAVPWRSDNPGPDFGLPGSAQGRDRLSGGRDQPYGLVPPNRASGA